MTSSRTKHTPSPKPPSVGEVLARVLRDPVGQIFRKWNWKSAVTSSIFRAPIFFLANLPAGLKPAAGAFITELVLRSITSGYYGSLTESIREAEPAWLAGLTAVVLMPLVNHTIELVVHWLRGTPRLAHSILASVCFTAFSTLFNLYVMRHGALIVGENSRPFAEDMRRMPGLVMGFIAAGPRALIRWFKGQGMRSLPLPPAPDWDNESS